MMKKNERGFGMVSVILSMAILLGLAYYFLKHGKEPTEQNRAALQRNGVDMPTNVDLNKSKNVEKYVNSKIQDATDAHQQKVDCAIDPESCKAGTTPAK